MKYLAQVSGTARNNDAGKIQNQIMQANPILEGIVAGKWNTKFFQLLEMQRLFEMIIVLDLENLFESNSTVKAFYQVLKLPITYLRRVELLNKPLESALIVSYWICHELLSFLDFTDIFYQLISGTSDEEKKLYKLESAETYNYLNQSGCTKIEGVDDVEEFKELSSAIDVVGISATEKDAIFRVLSGILHLGNVAFQVDESIIFALNFLLTFIQRKLLQLQR